MSRGRRSLRRTTRGVFGAHGLWITIAVALVIGKIFPMYMPVGFRGGGTRAFHFTDELEAAKGLQNIGVLLPIFLAIGVVIVGFTAQGASRATTRLAMAGGTLFLLFAVMPGSGFGRMPEQRWIAVVFFAAWSLVIAGAMTALRHPESRGARLLAGIGGAIGCALYFFPIQGSILFVEMFKALANAFVGGVGLIGLLTAAAFGIVLWLAPRAPRGLIVATPFLATGGFLLLGMQFLLVFPFPAVTEMSLGLKILGLFGGICSALVFSIVDLFDHLEDPGEPVA